MLIAIKLCFRVKEKSKNHTKNRKKEAKCLINSNFMIEKWTEMNL